MSEPVESAAPRPTAEPLDLPTSWDNLMRRWIAYAEMNRPLSPLVAQLIEDTQIVRGVISQRATEPRDPSPEYDGGATRERLTYCCANRGACILPAGHDGRCMDHDAGRDQVANKWRKRAREVLAALATPAAPRQSGGFS